MQIIPQILVFPVNIFLFKDNNKNTRKMCEIYLKLKIKIQEQTHLTFFSSVFVVDFVH